MITNQHYKLILASTSQSRKSLLNGADIAFEAVGSNINEDQIKQKNLKLGIIPSQTAQDLADAKAVIVSQQNRSNLTLGADQICHLNGEIFDKPGTKHRLATQIKALSGKTHILTSAISIALNGEIIFRYKDDVHMTMYDLTDLEIEKYLSAAEDDVVNAAGGYHIEAVGVQLFARIKGDYFTILGLPLLPLIGFLKQYGQQ